MGYMRHHAIVVTSYDEAILNRAHQFAETLFENVTPLTGKAVNGYRSFLVPPDGSKEGWDQSSQGDFNRDVFIDHLIGYRYADGSSPICWVEVQYGDEEYDTRVIRDSDDRVRQYSDRTTRCDKVTD